MTEVGQPRPIVAVTGGIGAGKSRFCAILGETYGIRVYDCDRAAKRIMAEDEGVKAALCDITGGEAYKGGILQKRVLAAYILASESNKAAVDGIVHPAVAADFMSSGLSWLESAILFGSGFHKRVPVDFTICVSAPVWERARRIMERDGLTHAKAMQWIAMQQPQGEVEALADAVVYNTDGCDLGKRAKEIMGLIGKL